MSQFTHPIVSVDLFPLHFIWIYLNKKLLDETLCVCGCSSVAHAQSLAPAALQACGLTSPQSPVGKLSESCRKLSEVFGKLSGSSHHALRAGITSSHHALRAERTRSDVIASYPGSLVDVPCRGPVTKAVTIGHFRH